MNSTVINTKPILFNTGMVRAIMAGQKTVTRRVVKPQPKLHGHWDWHGIKRPYQPGDILYVRETFCEETGKYYFRADFESDYLDACETLSGGYPSSCRYRDCDMCMAGPQRIYWRPSIHMPKEAARIFLRVTDVRVERLQDITPEQIDAEGFKEYGYSVETGELMPSGPSFFMIGWDKIIKPADLTTYGWAANPWVWVIEFERISKEEVPKT